MQARMPMAFSATWAHCWLPSPCHGGGNFFEPYACLSTRSSSWGHKWCSAHPVPAYSCPGSAVWASASKCFWNDRLARNWVLSLWLDHCPVLLHVPMGLGYWGKHRNIHVTHLLCYHSQCTTGSSADWICSLLFTGVTWITLKSRIETSQHWNGADELEKMHWDVFI